MVAGQVLQSAPKTVEVKENSFNRQGNKGGTKSVEDTREQEEINSTNETVGAILHGSPATEDKHAQVLPSSDLQPPNPAPQTPNPDDDDDEEVSWQSAARASLEKETKSSPPVKSSSNPVAKQTENQPRKIAANSEQKIETRATPQPTPNPQTPTPAPPPPPPTEQFTREELPTDFWGSESEPPPPSSYDDDEAFETATSASSGNGQNGKARATPKSSAKLPFDMPLFNELQALFPGRIVRIDVKQQKQAEESEESTVQANEAVSVVESEESE